MIMGSIVLVGTENLVLGNRDIWLWEIAGWVTNGIMGEVGMSYLARPS